MSANVLFLLALIELKFQEYSLQCFPYIIIHVIFLCETICLAGLIIIVSAARSLTCRDDLDSKWRLLLAENELSCVSLLSSISIGN